MAKNTADPALIRLAAKLSIPLLSSALVGTVFWLYDGLGS